MRAFTAGNASRAGGRGRGDEFPAGRRSPRRTWTWQNLRPRVRPWQSAMAAVGLAAAKDGSDCDLRTAIAAAWQKPMSGHDGHGRKATPGIGAAAWPWPRMAAPATWTRTRLCHGRGRCPDTAAMSGGQWPDTPAVSSRRWAHTARRPPTGLRSAGVLRVLNAPAGGRAGTEPTPRNGGRPRGAWSSHTRAHASDTASRPVTVRCRRAAALRRFRARCPRAGRTRDGRGDIDRAQWVNRSTCGLRTRRNS